MTVLDPLAAEAREAAWWRLHAALEQRPGWRVTPASFHAEERPWPRWHVTAIDLSRRGRGLLHDALEACGRTELEALDELVLMLEGRHRGP